jgi:hypothetical protein
MAALTRKYDMTTAISEAVKTMTPQQYRAFTSGHTDKGAATLAALTLLAANPQRSEQRKPA